MSPGFAPFCRRYRRHKKIAPMRKMARPAHPIPMPAFAPVLRVEDDDTVFVSLEDELTVLLAVDAIELCVWDVESKFDDDAPELELELDEVDVTSKLNSFSLKSSVMAG